MLWIKWKQEKGIESDGVPLQLVRLVKEGLPEEVNFEKNPDRSEGNKNIPDKRNSKCKALRWECIWPISGTARRPGGWRAVSIAENGMKWDRRGSHIVQGFVGLWIVYSGVASSWRRENRQLDLVKGSCGCYMEIDCGGKSWKESQ